MGSPETPSYESPPATEVVTTPEKTIDEEAKTNAEATRKVVEEEKKEKTQAEQEADDALATIPPSDPSGKGAVLEKQMNDFVTAIEQDNPSEDLRAKAKTELFKEGKIREGIKTIYSMLSGGTSRASEIPLPTIDTTTPTETVQAQLQKLTEAISATTDFKKKTELVNLLSELKRTLFAQQHNHTKPKNEQEMLDTMATKQELNPGDTILIRNEKPNVWYDKILSRAITSEMQAPRTHTAIISSINPLKIIHADGKVVHEIALSEYAAGLSQLDIMICPLSNAQASQRDTVVQYAKKQLGKPYDTKGLVTQSHGDDEKLFCTELADRAVRAAGIYEGKPLIGPSEIMNVLQPTYMCSLV